MINGGGDAINANRLHQGADARILLRDDRISMLKNMRRLRETKQAAKQKREQ